MKSVNDQITNDDPGKPGNKASSPASGTGGRLLSGSLPAAAMTFGLFTFMYLAIGSYEAPDEPEALPVLSKITPQIKDPETPANGYKKPKKIAAPTPPPQQAPFRADRVDVVFRTDGVIGKPPQRVDPAELLPTEMINTGRDTVAQPITAPVVVYPESMLRRGTEGSCDVRFDLSPFGEPFNIRPDCTHSGFERSAKKAVAGSRFSPKQVQGTPVERRNVVYPIEYNLGD